MQHLLIAVAEVREVTFQRFPRLRGHAKLEIPDCLVVDAAFLQIATRPLPGGGMDEDAFKVVGGVLEDGVEFLVLFSLGFVLPAVVRDGNAGALSETGQCFREGEVICALNE